MAAQPDVPRNCSTASSARFSGSDSRRSSFESRRRSVGEQEGNLEIPDPIPETETEQRLTVSPVSRFRSRVKAPGHVDTKFGEYSSKTLRMERVKSEPVQLAYRAVHTGGKVSLHVNKMHSHEELMTGGEDCESEEEVVPYGVMEPMDWMTHTPDVSPMYRGRHGRRSWSSSGGNPFYPPEGGAIHAVPSSTMSMGGLNISHTELAAICAPFYHQMLWAVEAHVMRRIHMHSAAVAGSGPPSHGVPSNPSCHDADATAPILNMRAAQNLLQSMNYMSEAAPVLAERPPSPVTPPPPMEQYDPVVARLSSMSAVSGVSGEDCMGLGHIKNTQKVCCHWKNKGWCRYQGNCKFLHPEEKRGIGSVKAVGSGVTMNPAGAPHAAYVSLPVYGAAGYGALPYQH